MANFDNSADMGKQMIFSFIKKRMKEKEITQLELAKLTGVNESTLIRNFKSETDMTISTLLKILGALEIRPYFISAEIYENEMLRHYFN